MKKNSAIAVRIRLVFIFLTVAFAALLYHLYNIQIERHDELYAKAREQYTCVTTNRGKRGEIYDFDGNMLVGNIPCFDICADPQIIGTRENAAKLANLFAQELHLDSSLIFKRLARKKAFISSHDGKKKEIDVRYAIIAKKVDIEKAEKIRKKIRGLGCKGIYFQETTKRYYPKNELLANILGFTNIDRDRAIAVIGLEKFFDRKISPTSSKSRFERSRDGTPLSYGNKTVNEFKDGLNLYLTVREPIQAILEEELDKLMEKWNPRAAYAIMVDPKNGNVLAVAQRPTFNPNDRSTMHPDAWRCRITEDVFEPGSIMKPIAVAGALDENIVNSETRFDCEKGSWFYAGKVLRDAHPMEILSVTEIIQKSSNIGTAKIALMMGENRLYRTLRKFGFGTHTGIPLKPETTGIFRPVRKWDKLSITRFPIGQGIAASPLQLARAYCALANGGKLLPLRLVDRVENPDTGLVISNPPHSALRVFKHDNTCKKIIDMMKLVTQEGGTARKAAIEGYNVAGKTGTSQKWINGAYSHKKFFASFVGFVPAEDPAFVLLVTVDEPQGAHYGGTIAAPAFKNIASRTLKYLDVKPNAEDKEKYFVVKN